MSVRRTRSGNPGWDGQLGATKIRVADSSHAVLMTLPKMGRGGNAYPRGLIDNKQTNKNILSLSAPVLYWL